ncbi:MAG: hypothetical protein ABIQ51_08600 [Mesorhizobium sp.]
MWIDFAHDLRSLSVILSGFFWWQIAASYHATFDLGYAAYIVFLALQFSNLIVAARDARTVHDKFAGSRVPDSDTLKSAAAFIAFVLAGLWAYFRPQRRPAAGTVLTGVGLELGTREQTARLIE